MNAFRNFNGKQGLKPVLIILVMIILTPHLSGQETKRIPPGKWERTVDEMTISITFDEEYNYKVDMGNDGQPDVFGTYSIEEDRITFNDKEGMAAPEPGIYTFLLKKEELIFELVEDPSFGRSGLLPGTWIRKTEQLQ